MRIIIRTYAYMYTHIYSYTCKSDVSVIQDENFSLCFIVVKEKESKKATSRRRKINILHKVNGDRVTNMDVASLHVFIG